LGGSPKKLPHPQKFFHEKKQKKRTTQKNFFLLFLVFYDLNKTRVSRTLLCGYKNNASQKNNHTKHTRFTTTLYTKNGSHYHGISG
jgi:hypothetical protein